MATRRPRGRRTPTPAPPDPVTGEPRLLLSEDGDPPVYLHGELTAKHLDAMANTLFSVAEEVAAAQEWLKAAAVDALEAGDAGRALMILRRWQTEAPSEIVASLRKGARCLDPDLERQPAQACTRCGAATYVSVYIGEERVPMCPECATEPKTPDDEKLETPFLTSE